jgi:hypothetical protein
MTAPQVELPQMCAKHQSLLVMQAKYKESDPWRALIIMAQVALFQGAVVDPATWDKVEGDVLKLKALGCLACYKPDRFGEIVEEAKKKELGAIKALGDSWVEAAKAQETDNG